MPSTLSRPLHRAASLPYGGLARVFEEDPQEDPEFTSRQLAVAVEVGKVG
jgi:hypothetical protein